MLKEETHLIDSQTFISYAINNYKDVDPVNTKFALLGIKICRECYYNPYFYLEENEIDGFDFKEYKKIITD